MHTRSAKKQKREERGREREKNVPAKWKNKRAKDDRRMRMRENGK